MLLPAVLRQRATLPSAFPHCPRCGLLVHSFLPSDRLRLPRLFDSLDQPPYHAIPQHRVSHPASSKPSAQAGRVCCLSVASLASLRRHVRCHFCSVRRQSCQPQAMEDDSAAAKANKRGGSELSGADDSSQPPTKKLHSSSSSSEEAAAGSMAAVEHGEAAATDPVPQTSGDDEGKGRKGKGGKVKKEKDSSYNRKEKSLGLLCEKSHTAAQHSAADRTTRIAQLPPSDDSSARGRSRLPVVTSAATYPGSSRSVCVCVCVFVGALSRSFLRAYEGGHRTGVSLDAVAKELNVERRRIYDIVNILEAVAVVSRSGKNNYTWSATATHCATQQHSAQHNRHSSLLLLVSGSVDCSYQARHLSVGRAHR